MKSASDPQRGKKSKGFALTITVKSSKSRIEQVTVEHISILEDLWHDYLFFKDESQKTVTFEQKRYLRVALLVLMAYLEGVTNLWCHNLLRERGDSKGRIKDFLFKNKLYAKIEMLNKYAVKKEPSIRAPVIEAAKHLRNILSHFQVGRDLEVFDGLTYALLIDTEQNVDKWLSVMETALGEKRHPNTQDLAKPLLDIDPDAKTEYSGMRSG